MEPAARSSTSFSSEQDLQEETRCLKFETKHKIFLSHSGWQKNFVAKLCKRLEEFDYQPFFDQRADSLPTGEKFSPYIFDAARKCQVAVVVLSKEYLSTYWPMVELVEFVRAKQSGNTSLKLFPLFYKASVGHLSNKSIDKEWRRKWMELVKPERKDNVEEWAGALRELRGVNGLSFDKFENSEEFYIDAIVNAIFDRVPPDFLYDTSKIFGWKRICQMLVDKFAVGTKTSAEVLGLYGMGGLGKTTMSKSLCNFFIQPFFGRVCHIEFKEGVTALERQKLVMKKLLRRRQSVIDEVCDVSQGWSFLQSRMKEYPVFLVVDNVQPDEESKKEVLEYLNVEYKSGSKIMVISRSLDVVRDLLGDRSCCYQIPSLTKKEAAGVFLHQVTPLMDYSKLKEDEKRVVENCLREVWFSHEVPMEANSYKEESLDRSEGGYFHPMSLTALGVHFHQRSNPSDILSWNAHLPEYGKLKGTRHPNRRFFNMFGLQFNNLDRVTKRMFLDICLYASKALQPAMLSNSPLEDMILWLSIVHEEPTEVVWSEILDLKSFSMLNIEGEKIIVHDLYKEYATWFLGQVERAEEIRGVWCVNKSRELDRSLPRELQRTPPGRCWPDLERIRMENIWCDGFPLGKVQEWCNVVVLQIVGCKKLTTINLQGLSCLRHLELRNLTALKTLTFTGDGSGFSSSMSQGTNTESRLYLLPPPLQFVTIDGLLQLQCLPSFTLFTSLKFLKVLNCDSLTQPPSVQHCSGLRRMWLSWHPNQISLPSLDGLTSLRDLTIGSIFWGRSCTALKLEGLSSLKSLGALELRNIPVGDLSGLENLTRVEYILLDSLYYLACLPPLANLARSSLHVLEVVTFGLCKDGLEGLDELQALIKLKLERLKAQGSTVPHIPTKIKTPPVQKLLRCLAFVERARSSDEGEIVLLEMRGEGDRRDPRSARCI